MGDGGCLVVLFISFVYEYAHFRVIVIIDVIGLFLCIVVVGIWRHGRNGRR